MSAAPRPGWYPDPAGTPELYRWWDGGGWSDAISESPRAPSPRIQAPADPEDDLRRRRPSRFRTVVALLVCLALFLGATVGLGLAIWKDPPAVRRSASPPGAAGATPVATVPTSSSAVGRLDEQTRVATIGAASMVLPDRPYVLSPDAMSSPAVMDAFFLASAPVHPAQGERQGWSAAVLLGRLTGSATTSEQLAARGRRAMPQLGATLFDGRPLRWQQVTVADHAVDGNRGLRITARVHYDIAGLASRYDVLTAVLVSLDDGSMVVAVSSVPDDAEAEVSALAATSLASLSLG